MRAAKQSRRIHIAKAACYHLSISNSLARAASSRAVTITLGMRRVNTRRTVAHRLSVEQMATLELSLKEL